VRWHAAGTEVPRVQLHSWSGHQAHDAPKSLERFKQRIRDITRRAKGVSIKTTMMSWASICGAGSGYFGFCETPQVLIALTRWGPLRLRAASGAMETHGVGERH